MPRTTLAKLGLFLFLFLSLGSCRMGNRVESISNPDTITGLYDMKAQSLKFCATNTQTLCKNITTNLIPRIVSDSISDPVALIMQNLETGRAVLTPPSGRGGAMPVYVGPDRNLSLIASTTPETAWKDGRCLSLFDLEENGKIVAPGPGVETSARSSGRIQLTVRLINRFDGDCESTFRDLHDCYLDQRQCGGRDSAENENLHSRAQEMFNAYIEAGVMTPAEIPTLRNLAFEVSYQ